jgi:hypothetical protein
MYQYNPIWVEIMDTLHEDLLCVSVGISVNIYRAINVPNKCYRENKYYAQYTLSVSLTGFKVN